MQKCQNRNDTLLHITILALCIFPVIISFFLFTDSRSTEFRLFGLNAGVGIPCFFKALSGFSCPACGMTRAFIFMSNFNFSAACEMNRAGVLLYIFCVLQLPYRLLRIFRPLNAAYTSIVRLEAAYLIFIGIVAFVDFILQFLR